MVERRGHGLRRGHHRRSEIVARHDRPLTGHDPAEVADLLGEMTTEPAHGHPRLAAAGDPLPARVIEEAGCALGALVAQISDFVLPRKILLAGEGVGLMDVAGRTVEESIRVNRHPPAAPVDLETKVSDFHDWARGAAVLALQVRVLGAVEV
ncbi:hypothetical protein [Streptomyces griseoloalbus]|uniref:hypothetical protein n=1 Tax=Streptomyces griseoloalbus TaxID=67303 RepID=UPI003F694559